MNRNKVLWRFLATLSCLIVSAAGAADASDELDEIIVTADYRARPVREMPASISTLDNEQIEQLATQHFEELINVIPNLNWSGDGHRARYFQIRGVGELEQYQGAPNPSVGFLIDDIDFSGIGAIATLFDMQRIEVLRGPQGSRYGANALGGLIYMQSTLPSAERDGRLQLSAGDDDARSIGLAFGGALDEQETTLFRVSAHHYESNGFRNNPYLGREDSNGRDETTIRGRLSLLPRDDIEIRLAAFSSNVDNGYDAFAIDNSFTVLSDKPGKDAQDSVGASARVDWSGWSTVTLTSITALANSNMDFSFDADWGNDDAWAPVLYDYVSLSDRERNTISQEFRLASTADSEVDWLVGLYALRLEDDLLTIDQGIYFDPGFNFADGVDNRFSSDYAATNLAMFGQLEFGIAAATRMAVGLRIERRNSDYLDSVGLSASPADTMVGGEVSVMHEHSSTLNSYVALSKGFKAGGINLGAVPADRREFGKEALWSLEAGIKSVLLDGSLSLNAAVFHNIREDQQVRASFQLDPNNPASFGFVTQNVARGRTTGVETELRWFASESLEFYANLGLLDSELGGFNREQAHAPGFTLATGAAWRHASGWFARVDVTAKDEFFFDVSHDQKSEAYELVHARVGYVADNWSAQLWARNLFDQDYAVRGFFFGNEPPNFPPTLYTRFGDPRQLGITFEKRFGS